MRASKVVSFLFVLHLLVWAQLTTAQELDEQEFQKLHDALKPGDEEWRSIPWQTNLLDAQRLAAESQKPIFIWAMDGHPLGCT